MPNTPQTLTEAYRLRDLFAAQGALVIEADVLQSAETLKRCPQNMYPLEPLRN